MTNPKKTRTKTSKMILTRKFRSIRTMNQTTGYMIETRMNLSLRSRNAPEFHPWEILGEMNHHLFLPTDLTPPCQPIRQGARTYALSLAICAIISTMELSACTAENISRRTCQLNPAKHGGIQDTPPDSRIWKACSPLNVILGLFCRSDAPCLCETR